LSSSRRLNGQWSAEWIVQVSDAFWRPLLDRDRAITIPHNLRMCRGVGIVANFERVAGLLNDDYHGLPNWDEFLYMAIEAACYGLRPRPDKPQTLEQSR
jgi:hypothetical protein